MTKLSVVIITFNEEANIERCLQSVTDIADEIVVVDSFSTDRTKEICSRYPVIFYERKFVNYFDQKNWANSKATHPLIFSIDADEAVSEKLAVSIKKMKEQPDAGAWQMKRLTNYCGQWIRHCGWYPDTKIRIWKKELANWEGEIHETLKFNQQPVVFMLEGDLLHYSFRDIEQHVKKVGYFSGFMAEVAFKKRKKANTLHLLLKPCVKFFSIYFLKLGFMDGFYGFVIAKNSAYASFLKYAKLKEWWLKNKQG